MDGDTGFTAASRMRMIDGLLSGGSLMALFSQQYTQDFSLVNVDICSYFLL